MLPSAVDHGKGIRNDPVMGSAHVREKNIFGRWSRDSA
jgi:hypothetical protein